MADGTKMPSSQAIELWGGVNTPCFSDFQEQGEYAFVSRGLVVGASGGRAPATSLGTGGYRNSCRVTASTIASHHRGIYQQRVFLEGENSVEAFLHEPLFDCKFL